MASILLHSYYLFKIFKQESVIKGLNFTSIFLVLSILAISCSPSKRDNDSSSSSPSPKAGPKAPESKEEQGGITLKPVEEVPAPQPVQKIQAMNVKDSCDLIKNLELKNKRKHLATKYGHYQLFSTPLVNGSKTYSIQDLANNYFETFPFRAKINASNFRARLKRSAIEGILKNQKNYMGILKLEGLEDEMEDLNACIKKDPYISDLATIAVVHNNRENDKLYEAFLIDNLIKAFKAEILWSYVREVEGKIATEQGPIYKNIHYTKHGNVSWHTKKQLKDVEKKYQGEIDKAMGPLGAMMSEAPMLFDLENDFEITDWVNLSIVRSEIAKNLISGFPREVLNQMKKDYEANPSVLAFQNVLLGPEHQAMLTSFANTKLKDKELRKLFRKKLNVYIDTANAGAVNICENEGENLHHSDELVKVTLDQNAIRDDYKSIMSRDNAAYCYLLETEPKEDLDAFTWKTGVGIAAMGVGAGLQIFIGPGTLAGTALMVSGGALITGETAYNSYVSKEQERESRALQSTGWADYREVIRLTEQTTDLTSDVGTDAVLSFVAAGSGKAIQLSKRSKRISDEELLESVDDPMLNNQIFTRFSKYNLGNNSQMLLEEGSEASLKLYKKIIWKRHSAMWDEFVESGDRYKLVSKREWYRIKNSNQIPAYHLYGKSGEETFGILDVVKSGKRLGKEEGEEALEAVQKWIADYKSYKTELDSAVDNGFAALKQHKKLQKLLKTYKPENFFGGKSKKIQVTKVVDGEYKEVEKTFQSFYDLDAYVKQQVKLSESTFARNSLEELTTNSDIYKIMDQQAIDFRRLEFLRDTLKNVPKAERTEEQIKLLRQAKLLLKDEELMPRPDAIIRLQRLELAAERADFVRSMRSKKRLMKKMHFELSNTAKAAINDTGPIGKYFEMASMFVLSGATTAVIHQLTESGGPLDEIGARIDIAYDEIIRTINHGYTEAELECAEQLRHFSFMVCFGALTKRNLGVERARAIITDDTYSFRNDPVVVRKALDYAHKILKLRKKFRGAELFILGDSILNLTYTTHAKREIIEMIDKISKNDLDVAAKINQVIYSEDKDKARELLTKYEKDLGTDFTAAVKYIIVEEKFIVDSIRSSARLPQELENLIKGIDLDEAEHDINDDDFFELTVDMIEQAKNEQEI